MKDKSTFRAGPDNPTFTEHRRRLDTRTALVTIAGGLVVAGVAAMAFIYSGIYDVAAITPDNAMVAWAIHLASDRSIAARDGDIQVPTNLNKPEILSAGGMLFSQNCAVCHSGPGMHQTDISQGLNPQPPNLFATGRKPEMNEAFWFIKNGVKMTAMPGFAKSQTDEQIWALAAFVGKAPGMSASDFADQTGLKASALDNKQSGG